MGTSLHHPRTHQIRIQAYGHVIRLVGTWAQLRATVLERLAHLEVCPGHALREVRIWQLALNLVRRWSAD